MAETKDVMSIKELSAYLGIGKSKIYNLIRLNKIPASKIGRQYRFSKEVIDNWLKEKIITIPQPPQMELFKGVPKEKETKKETTNEHM
ncbi:MAG: helix-turn-helix domain-containing protein [Elusimicrobiota bacterium]